MLVNIKDLNYCYRGIINRWTHKAAHVLQFMKYWSKPLFGYSSGAISSCPTFPGTGRPFGSEAIKSNYGEI